jgi:hypothetical protein
VASPASEAVIRDVAGSTRGQQAGHERAEPVDHPAQVHREEGVPLARVGLPGCAEGCADDAGVEADQVGVRGRGGQLLHGHRVRDIGGDRGGVQAGGDLGERRGVHVGQYQAGTGRGQAGGQRAPDAAGSAGDDRRGDVHEGLSFPATEPVP